MPLQRPTALWLALASTALAQSQASMDKTQNIIYAHGLIMAISFAALYPLGAIVIRLLPFRGAVWLHAAWQGFTYVAVLGGFGLGVWIATTGQEWLGPVSDTMNNGHPIIGTAVVGLLLLQPLLGLLHHKHYKQKGTRTISSYLHIWIGRIAVTAGIINGGLGIQLSGGPSWAIPAYSAVAGVFFLAWVVSAVVGETRRKKREGKVEKVESSRKS